MVEWPHLGRRSQTDNNNNTRSKPQGVENAAYRDDDGDIFFQDDPKMIETIYMYHNVKLLYTYMYCDHYRMKLFVSIAWEDFNHTEITVLSVCVALVAPVLPKVTRKFWATFVFNFFCTVNEYTSWPPYGPGRYSRHAHVYLPCHSQQYTHVLLINHYRSRFLSESEGRNTFPTEPHISHPNVWDVHLSHPRSMTKMWTIWAEC